MKIAVVLPTLNEVESVADIISRTQKVNPDYEVYVVDSGSTDGTVEAASKAGARLITLTERGKGIAIKKAFSEITADIIVLLDSDGSYHPEEIPVLIGALNGFDVVVGSRFKGHIEDGAMKSVNKFGNKALTSLARFLYHKEISDVCTGFWVFRKEAYNKIDIHAPHFTLEANFYVECARNNLKVCEVPINYTARKGETKLNILHGFEIGMYLVERKFSGLSRAEVSGTPKKPSTTSGEVIVK